MLWPIARFKAWVIWVVRLAKTLLLCPRPMANRLTDDQVRELVAAFEAGEATRLELAER